MTEDSHDDAEGPEKQGKPARKGFLLRVSPELMVELRRWSEQELRSLNGHIEYLLREALKRRKGEQPPDEEAP